MPSSKAEDTSDALKRLPSNDIASYPEGIILPIDKPYRWTSADVLRKLKWAAVRFFGKKNLKVGHAGTLDPLATGLLLVCIGAATKKAESLQASRKEYVAGVSFGACTASYDLEKQLESFCPADCVNEESLRTALESFRGEQMQVAPLFSAKSVDGVRAYETARKLYAKGALEDTSGLLQASKVNIYDLELLSFDPSPCYPRPEELEGRSARINVEDISSLHLPLARVRLECSKGTYIRSFARDLGEALGTRAFLSSLRRTKNGGFTLEDAVTLDQALELFKLD